MWQLKRFIISQSFKMATLKMVATSFCVGVDVVSLDLSDAYFHVRIHRDSRHFLFFRLDGKFYQFHAMPFHLGFALQVYTKLTLPIMLFCRHLGILIIFLDDTIIMAWSCAVLLQHQHLVLEIFMQLALMIYMTKSDLAPSQQFMYLGLCWSTAIALVSLPQDKLEKIHASASCVLSAGGTSHWILKKFLGWTNFASFAVPRAWLHSHAPQITLSSDYCSIVDCFRRLHVGRDSSTRIALVGLIVRGEQTTLSSPPLFSNCHWCVATMGSYIGSPPHLILSIYPNSIGHPQCCC